MRSGKEGDREIMRDQWFKRDSKMYPAAGDVFLKFDRDWTITRNSQGLVQYRLGEYGHKCHGPLYEVGILRFREWAETAKVSLQSTQGDIDYAAYLEDMKTHEAGMARTKGD